LKVREEIESLKAELLERRYAFPVGKLMGVVREKLKWADGKLLKDVTEKEVGVAYGEKWGKCDLGGERKLVGALHYWVW